MRTSQSFGVHFTIKREKAKDGVTNVYAAVVINKEKTLFALKHYVKVDNWDKGRGGLKIKVPEAKETNAYLEQVKFTITTYLGVSEICYTLFRGKTDHLFAGKEMQPML
jgi:hypothetical protein